MVGAAGRPKAYPVKKLAALSNSMMDRISNWRSSQPDAPNESEAIRRLLQFALDRLETPHTLFRRCLKASQEGAAIKHIRNTILDDHPLVDSITTDDQGLSVVLKHIDTFKSGDYAMRIRYIAHCDHWTLEQVRDPA